MKATKETTIKDLKKEISKSFLFGELDDAQYELYKGGEQENKDKQKGSDELILYRH